MGELPWPSQEKALVSDKKSQSQSGRLSSIVRTYTLGNAVPKHRIAQRLTHVTAVQSLSYTEGNASPGEPADPGEQPQLWPSCVRFHSQELKWKIMLRTTTRVLTASGAKGSRDELRCTLHLPRKCTYTSLADYLHVLVVHKLSP